MRGDDGDRWNSHEALQDAAGSELDPMLERKHLLKRHAGRRRVMDLLTLRLAEIPSEGRAIRDGDLLKAPAYAEDGPILQTIRFRGYRKSMLIKADKHMGSFLRWMDTYPRAAPFDV